MPRKAPQRPAQPSKPFSPSPGARTSDGRALWPSISAHFPGEIIRVPYPGTVIHNPGRTIELPTPPTVNHAYATVNGRRVLSKEGKAYKATVQGMLSAAGWTPFEGPVAWTMEWRRAQKRGDSSNRIKNLEDCMKGFAWHDDSQVVELHFYRRDDPDHAGVTFSVEPR